MKRIIALTLLFMLVLMLCGCANGYVEETSDTSRGDCPYCGDLAGGNRWFIAKVTGKGMVMPLGTDCFEAISAGDAGISLNVSEFAQGDIVRITYNGMIMESYPVQIHAQSIEFADIDQ